jgi:hypothetical protein
MCEARDRQYLVTKIIEGVLGRELTPRFQSCSDEKFISYLTPPHKQPPVTFWGVLSIDVAAMMLIDTES